MLDTFRAEYLYFWLRANRTYLQSLGNGATFKEISKAIVERIEIPLPPLAEQKRIAALLDEADALRRKRREVLTKFDMLVQSVFMGMFGDPLTNPKGWEICAFDQVAKSQLGKMLDEKKQGHLPQRKYLRNANVRWGKFDLTDVFEMGVSDSERDRFKVLPGDLLVCEGGEPGRAAIWNGQISDCYYQKALHRIRVDPMICTSEYLLYLLWRLSISGGLADSISLVTIAHLTGEKLKKLLIPVPPFRLQQNFASRVSEINAMRERYEISLSRQETLFAVLQHRAFSIGDTSNLTTTPQHTDAQSCLTLDF